MGPKAHSAIMFFNSVTRAMGTNAVEEFLTRCTTVRQSSKAVVPTASFHERVDVQLRTLGDQITHVSLELTPTQSMLMQIKQRVLEVVDEMTMVASRADESCAMVFSLTEEVQQREESRQLCRMWS